LIPIEDHLWYRLDMSAYPLPDGHCAEATMTLEGECVVRITGPNAHVLGKGQSFVDAIQAALLWFGQVGGEL